MNRLIVACVLAVSLSFVITSYSIHYTKLYDGRDLAQACRDRYPGPVNFALWILCEIVV